MGKKPVDLLEYGIGIKNVKKLVRFLNKNPNVDLENPKTKKTVETLYGIKKVKDNKTKD